MDIIFALWSEHLQKHKKIDRTNYKRRTRSHFNCCVPGSTNSKRTRPSPRNWIETNFICLPHMLGVLVVVGEMVVVGELVGFPCMFCSSWNIHAFYRYSFQRSLDTCVTHQHTSSSTQKKNNMKRMWSFSLNKSFSAYLNWGHIYHASIFFSSLWNNKEIMVLVVIWISLVRLSRTYTAPHPMGLMPHFCV